LDQINALTPPDLTGTAEIAVTSPIGRIQGSTLSVNAATPAFLQFGPRYIAATHADYSLAGPTSLYPGFSTPVERGETVVLWGAGFGLPASTITPGSASQSAAMPGKLACTVGARPADALLFLVSPGLYQINLVVPADVGSGDQPVSCVYAGVTTPDGRLINVR
jgi:uncharacterized protein (TIGR03437 family)